MAPSLTADAKKWMRRVAESTSVPVSAAGPSSDLHELQTGSCTCSMDRALCTAGGFFPISIQYTVALEELVEVLTEDALEVDDPITRMLIFHKGANP